MTIPTRVPVEFIEAQCGQIAKDYAKWMADNEAPFFVPDTVADARNLIKTVTLSVPLSIALERRRTISMADTRRDLAELSPPTLILHGDKDAAVAAHEGEDSEIIKSSRLSDDNKGALQPKQSCKREAMPPYILGASAVPVCIVVR
jgi:non-heme chloroperoxidase